MTQDSPPPAMSDPTQLPQAEALLAAWHALQEDPSPESKAAYEEATETLRSGPLLGPGEIVDGRFRLLEKLGDGGLSAAWFAWDLPENEPCVVKVLHSQYLTNAELVQQFHDAASSQASLAGAGVLGVRTEGRAWRGFHYVATDHAPRSLEAAAQELPAGGKRQLLIDACDALTRAHARGIAHGRLSPHNLLIDSAGRALLTDFEMVPPAAMGSVYAAPESSEPGWLPTARADRYELAMVALFAFHGPLPFWILRDPERLIRQLNLGPDLTEVLSRSASWTPSERPDSLDDLRSALEGGVQESRELAAWAVASGRPESAIPHYERLLDLTAGDPNLLVELARALAAAGRAQEASERLFTAIQSPDLVDVDAALGELRALAEHTGDMAPLLEALRARAKEDPEHRAPFLLEAARLRAADGSKDPAPWEEALAVHSTREQARASLEALVDLAEAREDWPTFVRWGRELIHYTTEPANLEHRVGRVFLDRLSDQQNGLLWLDRALNHGFEDPDLAATLEDIRSARGDWPQVISLMLSQAEGRPVEQATELRRRAATLARWAAGDAQQALDIHRRILTDNPGDPQALRSLAHGALASGDQALALQHLRALAPHQDLVDAHALATLLADSGAHTDASDVVLATLHLEPAHVPSLWLAAVLARDAGSATGVIDHLTRLSELLGGPERADALVGLGDVAWRRGDLTAAHASYTRALEQAPEHAGACWGLARVAWSARPEHAPWLRATPQRFTAQEALARLLCFLIEPAAIRAWTSLDPIGVALEGERSPLEQAALATDVLHARGLIDEAFFLRLFAAFSPSEDDIERVRRLWLEAPNLNESFPVAHSYRWTAALKLDHTDFPVDQLRSVLPLSPATTPWSAARPLVQESAADPWEVLLVASGLTLAESAEVLTTAPPATMEPTDRPTLVVHTPGSPQQAFTIDHNTTLGGSVDDDIFLEGVEAGRAQITRAGTALYLSTQGAPVQLQGRAIQEGRLLPEAEIQIGDHTLRFLLLAPEEELPEVPAESEEIFLEIPNEEEDEELSEEDDVDLLLPEDALSVQPARAALTYLDEGGERMRPLLEQEQTLGDGEDRWRVRAEDGAWLLASATNDSDVDLLSERLLTDGDQFTVQGVTYTFRLVDRAPPLELPPADDELVPLLIIDDGSLLGKALPVLISEFKIGRGRTADLKLGADSKISRHHCTVAVREDGIYLVDNNSSNGTFLDGEKVSTRRLEPGQIIEIGDTRIEFRMGPRGGEPVAKTSKDPTLIVEDELTITSSVKSLPPLPLGEGEGRIIAANRALSIMIAALDSAKGSGAGVAALQLFIDGGPRRYNDLFKDIQAYQLGLPPMPLMFNLAQRPAPAQRHLLNTGLLDLVERSLSSISEQLTEAEAEAMLQRVAKSNYREHLRL